MASGTIRQAIYSDTYNYIKFNEGILIQRGVASSKSGDLITYPMPFKEAPHVYVTPIYNTSSTIQCIFSFAGNSATSVRIYAYDTVTHAQSTSETLRFDWLAIGYWK